MIAIVDADLIVYRCGFSVQKTAYRARVPNGEWQTFRYAKELKEWREGKNDVEVHLEQIVEPIEHAYHNINTTLANIQGKLQCPMELYLTGKGNYRYDLATIQPYKGNRSEFGRPRYYKELKEYLINRHKAKLIDGWEADDEVAIRSIEEGDDAIIVSNDKDLDMIPGKHYNWVKDIAYELDDREAIRNFHLQILTGDSTDNIPGIPGVGPATAAKLLEGCTKPGSLWGAVYRAYFDRYGHRYDDNHTLDEAVIEIARLLWIKRTRDNELWSPPK